MGKNGKLRGKNNGTKKQWRRGKVKQGKKAARGKMGEGENKDKKESEERKTRKKQCG